MNLRITIVLAVLLVAAAMVTWRVQRHVPTGSASGSTSAPMPAADSGIAYYTCSMHPEVKRLEPGACPICKMELTPVTAEDLHGGVVTVDEARRKVTGIKTATVATHALIRRLRASALVAYDQTRLTDVAVRSGGWIGTLTADFVGKPVTAGETLFTLYSPELVAAQGELIAAAAGKSTDLLAAARAKLIRLGMSPTQIDEVARAGIPVDQVRIVSPVDGTVVEKAIVAGGRVDAGARALRIADLSRVWIEAALPEADVALVTTGMTADIALGSAGPSVSGAVAFVDPVVDAATRTGRVRVEAANADGQLRPGMLVICAISVPLGERLAVPEDAVVIAGDQRVVFRDLGGGKLAPVHVTTGERADGLVEITAGLAAGDTIAATGVFLIASESRLKSGLASW